MSVELDPAELGFKRPYTHEVSQVLRLHNPNNDPVAFKVKTTAPKQYCVRPNSGRIDSGQHVEVQVLLQAMKEDPPPDARCRDKFLVQSVAVSASNDSPNISQVWSNIEQTAKSSIQEKKIRVNFLPADESSTTGDDAAMAAGGGAALAAGGAAASAAATTNGVSHDEEAPPAYSSPSPSAVSAVTPQRSSATTAPSTVEKEKSLDDTLPSSTSAGQSSALGAVAAAVPTSQEDIKKQLEEAKATIARLRSQAEEGLRQRKIPGTDGDKSVTEQVSQSLQNAPAPGGVPVQIVAALCLICFLIAYLFF